MTQDLSGHINKEETRGAQSLFFMPDAAPPQEFFGRQPELTRLQNWLSGAEIKVAIIHGFGGTGKTELARQALARSRYGTTIW